MPRYVILEHDHPFLHWDLMLEEEGTLRTWRLSSPPQSGQTNAALALGSHRLEYLTYEGPVSGDRGTVSRWDAGSYNTELQAEDQVAVRLAGNRFSGLLVLERLRGEEWLVTSM